MTVTTTCLRICVPIFRRSGGGSPFCTATAGITCSAPKMTAWSGSSQTSLDSLDPLGAIKNKTPANSGRGNRDQPIFSGGPLVRDYLNHDYRYRGCRRGLSRSSGDCHKKAALRAVWQHSPSKVVRPLLCHSAERWLFQPQPGCSLKRRQTLWVSR